MVRLGYVWRNLFQRKIRTGLSMLGVSVSVAGIVALISVAQGMRTSLDRYMEATGASLIVFKRNVADLIFSSVNAEEIAAIRAMPGVEAISRSHLLMIKPPVTGDKPPSVPILIIFGRYPEERIMKRHAGFLTEGRLFTQREEFIASRLLANRLGWRVGQKIALLGKEKYELVGLFSSDIPWENGAIVMHAEILGRHLGRKDNYNLIFVYTQPEDEARVKTEVEERFPHLLAVPPGEFTATFDDQLAIIDEFIWMVTIIALVVGVLGVLNTMMMSVSERTREIGMLRACGWPRSLVIRLVLLEGMLLSIVGGLIGLGLGVAGTEGLIHLFPDAFLVAEYTPATFVKGGLVAIVVGVLAALYPAYRAANLAPVEALRFE